MRVFIFLNLFALLLNVIACGNIYEIPHEEGGAEVEAEEEAAAELENCLEEPFPEGSNCEEAEDPHSGNENSNTPVYEEPSPPESPNPRDPEDQDNQEDQDSKGEIPKEEGESVEPEEDAPEKSEPEEGNHEEGDPVEPEENQPENGQPEKEKPNEDSSDSTEEILFNEVISEKVLVGEVKAGDSIILRMEGIQATQKFSDIYHRGFSSSWQEKECDLSIVERSGGGFSKGGSDDCFLYTQFGTCTMAYRDYAGEVISPIEFTQDPQSLPLQVLIGDKSYRLDRIIKRKGHTVVATLQIRKAMIQGAANNRLYLKPIHDMGGEVQTGFLDYVDCPRKGRRQFNPGGPTTSVMVTNDVRRELQVNLKVTRE